MNENENERIESILAEMRQRIAVKMSDAWYTQAEWRNLCDRIEAAWKRQEQCYLDQVRDAVNMIGHERFMKEHPPVGNAAAMREALLRCKAISCLPDIREQQCVRDMRNIIAAALSAPARNCDVGTAEEQAMRFRDVCNKYYNDEYECDKNCPLASLDITHGFPRCQSYWAQMPYEAQEGGAK